MFELTVFRKAGGPLTKRIACGPDGAIKSDGSQCIMARGSARRAVFEGGEAFARAIGELGEDEALALGALRGDLPEEVSVVAKRKLNGSGELGIIARTQEYITYRPDTPGLVLLDFDEKGMTPAVAQRLTDRGGLWEALVSVLPQLAGVARVERASTSAGLYDLQTNAKYPGTGGRHIYVSVTDSADAERFSKTLPERCWLAGFGWYTVGRCGQLLDRSIVDRVCGGPERLVFEGRPVLDPPLAQDANTRRPLAVAGNELDTLAACPPLSVVELARLQELKSRAEYGLAAEAAAAREAFVDEQSRELAKRRGIELHRARRAVERQCQGVLLPNTELPFDDPDLVGTTVADVLAGPLRFEGATLADPNEGVEYGRCKARIMRRADGSVWINSFAHGRTVYELKNDFAAAHAGLEKSTSSEVPDELVRLVRSADLDAVELEELRNMACEKTGITKHAMGRKIRNAMSAAAEQRKQVEANRRMAERRDPRPMIRVPAADAEFGPQMETLNDVMRGDRSAEPPTRNPDKRVAMVRKFQAPSLHALASMEINRDDDDNEPAAAARAVDFAAAK
jgi:hypothetical protein